MQRTYPALLATLRNEPESLAHLREITELLASEGAAGSLDTVRCDAELIRRSRLYDAQITPMIDLLDESIRKARQRHGL